MIPIRLLVCVAGLVFAQPLLAQQQTPRPVGPRVSVMIVLSDTMATEPGFRIIRHASGEPLDVIALRGPATSETLSAAVRSLMLVRAAQGDTATVDGMVRIRPAHPGASSAPRLFPWADRVLVDLRLSPTREIRDLGLVRAIEIWLPPQRQRNSPPNR